MKKTIFLIIAASTISHCGYCLKTVNIEGKETPQKSITIACVENTKVILNPNGNATQLFDPFNGKPMPCTCGKR